ncbi:MAG: site-2 protease family protein [Candidatus Margulisiibacteriota bacterium]
MVITISLCVLIVSVVLHELAHGWGALAFGDDTAKREGRLTLNPLKHIDLIGSVLVPAMLVLTQVPMLFGWAKPVPIDSEKMRDPRFDIVWVSLAGPLTNGLLVLVGFLGLKWVIGHIGTDLFHTYLRLSSAVKGHILLRSEPGMVYVMLEICLQLILINTSLGLFNLFPIPPLDGSRVFVPFLSKSWQPGYAWFEKYGILVLFVLMYFNVFSPFFSVVFRVLYHQIWFIR